MWKKLWSRLDDGINPIVVKELRQAVQSRFISGVIYLFLLVQIFYLGVALIEKEMNSYSSTNLYAGRSIFMSLLHILMFVCVFFVPSYAAVRFASERSDTNVDLLFITTIQPWNIVWGKLLASMVLTLLLYSICMPFMSFTYLLRGIDLPSIFILLAFDFLIVAAVVQFAILLACLPTSRLFKMLLALAGLGVAAWIYGIMALLSEEFSRSGIASYMDTAKFWVTAGAVVVLLLSCIGLPFVLSLTVLTPPSANRALPVRVYMALAWLLCGITAVVMSLVNNEDAFIVVWVVCSTLLFSATIWVSVSERESPGRRVAKAIPRTRSKRFVAFFFYSGAANGVLFSLVMLGLTTLTVLSLWAVGGVASPYWGKFDEVAIFCAGIAGYAFCYSVSAVLVRRRLLGDRFKQLNHSALAFLLVVLASVLPILVCFLVAQEILRDEQSFPYWPNPFAFMASWRHREMYLVFILSWTCVSAVAILPWFSEQIKRFRPYRDDAAATESSDNKKNL